MAGKLDLTTRPAVRVGRRIGWRSYPYRRMTDITHRSADRQICLTFDDGPDPATTPPILDILDEHGVKAVFFMCGLTAQMQPEIVRRAAAAGHMIAGHTWNHPLLTALSDRNVAYQLDATHQLLEELCDRPIKYMRPPRNKYDARILGMSAERGISVLLASLDSRDWSGIRPDQIATRTRTAVEGDVILFHDAYAGPISNPPKPDVKRYNTVQALPETLRILKAKGLGATVLPEAPPAPTWYQRLSARVFT